MLSLVKLVLQLFMLINKLGELRMSRKVLLSYEQFGGNKQEALIESYCALC